MVHFNWLELIVAHNLVHVATAFLATLILIGLGFAGRMALGKGAAAVAPAPRFSLKAFFELITELVVSLSDMVLGPKGRPFVPVFAGLFFFILFNNLFGLLPGLTPATENFNTTVALGLFSFIFYNYYGLRVHGISYFKQFLGPVFWLAWLFVIVELISHLIRPFSLGLRLYGNMRGDHTVLGIFLDLMPIWLPVPTIFYFLGIFVCFLQAFVFTILSMIYVSLAISHDH